jgi:hypothetical protein
MPIADVNGCKIYYEVNGIGPDVVFIHGEDHAVELFEQQVARLCGRPFRPSGVDHHVWARLKSCQGWIAMRYDWTG